jgi:predicted acylesterase/phospholipase RssA
MTKLETLVFCGGGLRGISYTGVAKLLEEYDLRKDLKHIVGSSIGAIAGVYIVLNYSYEDILEIVMDFDMKKIQDISASTILQAPATFGIDSGKKFMEFYKSLVIRKGYHVDITLKELFEINGIKFTIVTTCIEDCKAYYIDYLTDPDIPLWKAAYMSSCIPFIYVPFEYNGKHYIDGGIIDNHPLQYIDATKMNGLGFVLFDNIAGNELASPINYVMTIFKCYNHCITQEKFAKYDTNIIRIKVHNVKFYEASVEKSQLAELVKVGYESAKERIKLFAEEKKKALKAEKESKDSETQT